MLQIEQVKNIIEKGVSDKVHSAREYAELINMHITGLNASKYTEAFKNYESESQKEIRERLLKSNKSLFSFLLRPLDKIFTAKGGAISYNATESQIEEVKEHVSKISDGLDIKTYLKKQVKNQYIIDPNGFVMVDVDSEGNLSTKIFNSTDFLWYKNSGNYIDAVVFNPFKTSEDDDKEYYRVIDGEIDAIYVKDGDNIYLDEDSVKENFFGKVPAYILGDTQDPNSGLFLSLIDEVLEDAKEHLRDVSVNTVHKLSHGYSKYWQRPESCTNCAGEGEVKGRDTDGEIIDIICPSCNGSKIKSQKDASDLMIIPLPEEGEKDAAPNIGGFISPDLKIWQQYKEDISDIRDNMYKNLWGSTYSTSGKNETATGRALNVQPQAERVAGISVTFSMLHKFILDCYGKVVLFDKEYSCNVSYGTRYLMESPDQILKNYKEAKSSNLSVMLQNDLLDKYYQTEYTNNNFEYIKSKKLISTDPFPSMTAQDLKTLGVSEEDVLLKIYHPQWLMQLSDAKKVLMSIEDLKNDLEEYTKDKTLIKQKEDGNV